MAKSLLMEEFHLTAFVPRRLREPEYRAIRRALDSRRFRTELGRAVRQTFRRYPALQQVRIHSEQPRLLCTIQIKATRIIAFPNSY